jgi:Zn-dependent protease with chaperone function
LTFGLFADTSLAKRSDGRQFVSVLDRLEQTSKQASGGIFSTHPDLAERIQAAGSRRKSRPFQQNSGFLVGKKDTI